MDNRLHQLIPHRDSMLLLDEFISVTDTSASAKITISHDSSFYVEEKGVPTWVGVEYMGQTAALIAGHQLEKGTVEPHVGFLLGTRKFSANSAWFYEGQELLVECSELAVVGDSLATFDCKVSCEQSNEVLASCKLSVFRKPVE